MPDKCQGRYMVIYIKNLRLRIQNPEILMCLHKSGFQDE